MNPAEDLLALHLAELGLHFERQYAYTNGRRFKADFAVWRHGALGSGVCTTEDRLCLIEVTGGIYSKQAHGNVTGDRKSVV